MALGAKLSHFPGWATKCDHLIEELLTVDGLEWMRSAMAAEQLVRRPSAVAWWRGCVAGREMEHAPNALVASECPYHPLAAR